MKLNYKTSGSGPPIIILHGLFGMLDNWKTIGRELEKKLTVFLVDQRNHGKSPHHPEHKYKLMSEDIYQFITEHNLGAVYIMGHSMGGKAAMQFALDHGELVNKLIVVDMGMKEYPAGHDVIINALKGLDIKNIKSRKDAETLLSKEISGLGVRQFLLKNLTRNTDGTYQWKFNLNSLSSNYDSEILSAIVSDKPFNEKTLFIRGANSDYILNNDWDSIQGVFPNAKLLTIKNAGHWVHADQPDLLSKEVISFLLS